LTARASSASPIQVGLPPGEVKRQELYGARCVRHSDYFPRDLVPVDIYQKHVKLIRAKSGGEEFRCLYAHL